MAALHASPVVWVEVAVLTYWTSLLNCRPARGHNSSHVAKKWPTRSSVRVVAPLKSRNALENREISSLVEEGARGEVEGAKKDEISKWRTHEHGTLHHGQQQARMAQQ